MVLITFLLVCFNHVNEWNIQNNWILLCCYFLFLFYLFVFKLIECLHVSECYVFLSSSSSNVNGGYAYLYWISRHSFRFLFLCILCFRLFIFTAFSSKLFFFFFCYRKCFIHFFLYGAGLSNMVALNVCCEYFGRFIKFRWQGRLTWLVMVNKVWTETFCWTITP